MRAGRSVSGEEDATLFYEFVWKAIWVVSFGLPLWLTDQLTADAADTMTACLLGVVLVPIVLPWGYVFRKYVREPGNRWRGRPLGTVLKDHPQELGQSLSSRGS